MRRAVFAILGTAAATTLLVGIKAQADSAPSDPVALENPAPASGSGGTTPSPGAKGSTKPTGTPAPGGGAAGGAPKKITGKTVNTPYGAVTVTISVDGAKKITDVTAKVPDTGESAGAAPRLKEQVLQKQSADLDTVSGATYTSKAYKESLQAALDKR